VCYKTTKLLPNCHKSAIVKPLLKKTNLDPSDLNSYRPISNLSFVSKVLERLIDSRFTEHADLNNLFSPVQSAYRQHYSTETALVKVHNDIVAGIDQGHIGALMLLDMSAAFDTVDHHILLEILERRFCITVSALAWFSSYLSNRTQTVHVTDSISDFVSLSCGMPQDSFLGQKRSLPTPRMSTVFSRRTIWHITASLTTYRLTSTPCHLILLFPAFKAALLTTPANVARDGCSLTP